MEHSYYFSKDKEIKVGIYYDNQNLKNKNIDYMKI